MENIKRLKLARDLKSLTSIAESSLECNPIDLHTLNGEAKEFAKTLREIFEWYPFGVSCVRGYEEIMEEKEGSSESYRKMDLKEDERNNRTIKVNTKVYMGVHKKNGEITENGIAFVNLYDRNLIITFSPRHFHGRINPREKFFREFLNTKIEDLNKNLERVGIGEPYRIQHELRHPTACEGTSIGGYGDFLRYDSGRTLWRVDKDE